MSRPFEPLLGLSGTLWPVHLKPLPNELLSSWIVRLAHAHGCKVQTLCLHLFGRDRNVWSRDIDKLAPDWARQALIKATGATAAQFDQTTLRALEGVLADQVNINGVASGIIPLGIFHRSRRRSGLMWCPLCLRADEDPYFRKTWRLAYFTVCTRHRVYLKDTCDRCHAPIVPHRSDMYGRSVMPIGSLIAQCHQCRVSLREHEPQAASGSNTHLHAMFDQALTQGYVHLGSNPSLHSVLFFQGINALASGLASKRVRHQLLVTSAFSEIDLSSKSKGRLEMAPLTVRRQVMSMVAELLERWPENFSDLIRRSRLRYSDFKSDKMHLPFWFDDVIRREASRSISSISREHAESIANAVETRYGTFNGALARRLSGRDVLPKMPAHSVQAVSTDLYQTLMASLDHEIAETGDPLIRALLLRDKVMFAVSYMLGLSTTGLSGFTLHDCRARVPVREEAEFFTPPATLEQVRAWVEWYWVKIRPTLNSCTAEPHLFISAISGRSMKKSAISLRFNRAVLVAGLSRSIPNYGVWRLNGRS